MSIDLDAPPVYDPLTKGGDYLNDFWMSWISSFVQTLSSYLNQYGIFIPQLTTIQIDTVQSPIEGQIIYNTSILSPQIWQNGQWRTFTTTP